MDDKSKKSDVVPVKKGTAVSRAEPRHLLSPFEDMERLFEDFFPRSLLRHYRHGLSSASELTTPFEGRMPKVDVIDRDNEVFVRAELPGVDKKDIDISMTDNTVTIKGETRKEEKQEKGDYYRCETSHGAYTRTLSLPSEVNSEKTKAVFKDGVLELTLPKLERTKRRNIKVA